MEEHILQSKVTSNKVLQLAHTMKQNLISRWYGFRPIWIGPVRQFSVHEFLKAYKTDLSKFQFTTIPQPTLVLVPGKTRVTQYLH